MAPTEIPSEDSIVLVTAPVNPGGDYTIYYLAQEDSRPVLQQFSTQSPPSDILSKHLFSSRPSHLTVPELELHIIISTKSGTGKAEGTYESVLEPLLSAIGVQSPLIHAVEKTTSHETIRAYAHDVLRVKASEGVKQTVLLLSGDGGVVDLVNGLLEGGKPSSFVQPVLAIFPLGTGNALFHSIYRGTSTPQTDDLVSAIRSLLRGSTLPLPLFKSDFSEGACVLSDEGRIAKPVPSLTLYGAVVASYGFHSTLVADSDTTEYRKYGDKRFGMVAKELLDDPHAYKANVSLIGSGGFSERVLGSTEHGYVLVTLVSNLEKTFTISPSSKPLDGSLRVVHFGPLSGEKVMEIMTGAYDNGAHITHGKKLVDYEEVESVKIDFEEPGAEPIWRRVCIDGLIVSIEEGGWMKVSKVKESEGAIDVIAP